MPQLPPPAHPGAAFPNPPRLAATVVIARPGPADAVEIYMALRSAKSPFMPSTLVFPGGRLDEEDGDPGDDLTWQRAARRECAEEAALQLPGDLWWFDTWLTPSAEPRRRYLARFFLARLGADEGQEATADGHETHAGRWASVEAHLESWDRGAVDLPPPTLCTLLRLRATRWTGLPSLFEQDARPPILPKFVIQGTQHLIVMPHDPAYDATPGEGLPPPKRTSSLPSRFIRDGSTWRPCDHP
jgi:8-oxo-dGTP pyrophosphatase MutT (NUDIX family)